MLVKLVVLAIAASSMAATTTQALAQESPKAACEKQYAIVPTEQVAREIYEAVARGRGDVIKRANKIMVEDGNDHWEVFQYPKHLPAAQTVHGVTTVTVVQGGGTLEMKINKCDGSVLAHYSR